MADYDFQKELRNSVFNADPKLNRKELLEDIFKSYVAKMFEFVLSKKGKDRLEFNAMVTVKRNLINEFRKADLGEYQKSVEWYENTFENTIKEIFNDASHAHQGIEVVHIDQNLEINKRDYIDKGGIFVPEHIYR